MVSFVYSQSVPDEKILEMKTAFAKYDADGSGMLSNDEFRRIAPDMGVRHNSHKNGCQFYNSQSKNGCQFYNFVLLVSLSSPSFSQACLGKTNALASVFTKTRSRLQN